MAENSKIEWTDHTFNPWEGCQRVGPGCDHCYAEVRNARYAGGTAINWGPGAPRRRTSQANWKKPLDWNKQRFMECGACGWRGQCKAELIGCGSCGSIDAMNDVRPRVFCASLADVFDNAVDPQWRADLLSLIEATPNLDWLLVTKRIGNVGRMIPEATDLIDRGEGWQSMWGQGVWPSNVWLGATIVNQDEADRDIPKLIQIPARVRFLSMEPLLGMVNIAKWLDPFTCADCGHHGSEFDAGPDVCDGCYEPFGTEATCQHCGKDDQSAKRTCPSCGSGRSYERDYGFKFDSERQLIDWVIGGGESGPEARTTHPGWMRNLRDQCNSADVPFLFKQWGEWAPEDFDAVMQHGKAPLGCYASIDGRIFDAMPAHTDAAPMMRVGKKRAGRLLDGRAWDQFPETRA